MSCLHLESNGINGKVHLNLHHREQLLKDSYSVL